ncbi:MAG: DUF6036 family nucleotidyltransferase [Thermoplasmata archaeon]
MEYEELREKLQVVEDPTRRRMYFSALLGRTAGVPADDFIVVGGSAIEFYTVGAYTSGDIDIVSRAADRLRGVLRSWSFQREGRVWVHEALGMVVDFVRAPYTWDESRTQLLETPYGPIRVAALEDLLVKRLVSTKHWERTGDFQHALLLGELYADRMDWDYVEKMSRQQDVLDMLESLRNALGGSRGEG